MSKMSSHESERTTVEYPENRPNIDVWVEETFVNDDDDDRAVLAGDTYGLMVGVGESDNGIRSHLIRDTTNYTFDKQRSVWIVDVDGLEHLAAVADEYDMTVATETDGSTLSEAVEHVEEGANIDVEYVQKNGNGTNTKTGEVRSARITYDDVPVIKFVREDGQTMRVKPDEHGDISLFTGGHHPLVGIVTSVAIEG